MSDAHDDSDTVVQFSKENRQGPETPADVLKIKELIEKGDAAIRNGIGYYIEAGGLLDTVRKNAPRGAWEKWCKEVMGLSPVMCRIYIRLHQNRDIIEEEMNKHPEVALSLRAARALIRHSADEPKAKVGPDSNDSAADPAPERGKGSNSLSAEELFRELREVQARQLRRKSVRGTEARIRDALEAWNGGRRRDAVRELIDV